MTRICLLPWLPRASEVTASARASSAWKVPWSGTASSSSRSRCLRSLTGAAVSACGTAPPTISVKAHARGAAWMTASASFTARAKLDSPSTSSVMEEEPSRMIAMSRAPVRPTRRQPLQLSASTATMASVPRHAAAIQSRRRQTRSFQIATLTPTAMMASRPAASTARPEREAWPARKGRAKTSAAPARIRQRVTSRRISSISTRRRRWLRLSSRKRMAPQSEERDLRRLKRCRMMGTATPTSPSSSHGCRNSMRNHRGVWRARRYSARAWSKGRRVLRGT